MNFFKKSLSVLLAMSLALSNSSSTFAFTDNINNSQSKTTKSTLSTAKEGYKKHPKLFKLGIATGIAGAAFAGYKIGFWAYREWYIRDISTIIDGLTSQQINENLQFEIEKYKNRDKDIFKIDDNLIKKSDKRALLITLMKLNYLFDKYEGFTKELIEYKKSIKTDFLLRPLNVSDDGYIITSMAIERTEVDLGGFAFKLNNYKNTLYSCKKSVKSHFWSTRNMDELIDSIITHEFGHAIISLYIIKKYNLQIPKIRGLNIIEILKLAINKNDISKLALKTENIVNSITNEKNSFISKYADNSPSEYFAEAFAHLECNDISNINEVGKNTEKYIIENMKYLDKSKSKFYNKL